MNLPLEVREIFVQALALPRVDYVFSYTEIPNDADDRGFFWRTLEKKYNIALTKAQRDELKNCGDVIRYLELRFRADRENPSMAPWKNKSLTGWI